MKIRNRFGYIQYTKNRKTKEWYINKLYVYKPHRNKGNATVLLCRLLLELKGRGNITLRCSEVLGSDYNGLVRLYSRYNFRIIKEWTSLSGLRECDMILKNVLNVSQTIVVC